MKKYTSHSQAFEDYFNGSPYMEVVFKMLANAYLENKDPRFIHKCHVARISNAQDERNNKSVYYEELAKAALIVLKERGA